MRRTTDVVDARPITDKHLSMLDNGRWLDGVERYTLASEHNIPEYGEPYDLQIAIRVSSFKLASIRCRAVSPARSGWAASSDLWPPEPLPAGVDTVVFRSIPKKSDLPKRSVAGDWIRYVWLSYTNYFVDFGAGYEAYLNKFSAKSRNTLRRKVRKLRAANDGKLDIRSYHDPGRLAEFREQALSVSALTYQEKLFGGGLPADDDFWREAQRLATAGDLRAYLLFVGDRAVSYLYLQGFGDELRYTYLGFDPDYRKLSVGTVLLWGVLEQLFDESKFKRLDFTEGEGSHKKSFSNVSRPSSTIIFFRATPFFRFYTAMHRSIEAFTEAIARFVGRLGLRRKVRNWLRFSS